MALATAEVEGQADVTLHGVADRAARTAVPALPRRGVRPAVLAAVCVLAVAASGGFVLIRRDAAPAAASGALPTTASRLDQLTAHPYVMFRSTGLNRDYGKVALAAANDPAAARFITSMSCDRVDFVSGRGLCLTRTLPGSLSQPGVRVFDAHLRTTSTIQLTGIPSRTRVSPDGRYGAVTMFAHGDTYATMARFSTRTDILDLATGRVVLPLEQLRVSKDGRSFRRVDFNFWGVTFLADGDHFYATLGTGGHTYLVLASRLTRQATVVADGVECPSLSPDGTRIAFKQRDGGSAVSWHLAVMDLATMTSHRLATIGNVDDQATWLDDRTVGYSQVDAGPGGSPNSTGLSMLVSGGSVATSTWAVPADGSGQPRLVLAGAWSVRQVG